MNVDPRQISSDVQESLALLKDAGIVEARAKVRGVSAYLDSVDDERFAEIAHEMGEKTIRVALISMSLATSAEKLLRQLAQTSQTSLADGLEDAIRFFDDLDIVREHFEDLADVLAFDATDRSGPTIPHADVVAKYLA